jgi:glycosyltransferase involved in cell wall biosynthesis
MSGERLASIIINNYNYGGFLPEAIDSALNQTYRNTEVIVVDDGSTDNSRHVIARYSHSIKAIFKQNGGQISALNAGVLASRGTVIIFLDADDTLFPEAVERASGVFRDSNVANVLWPLIEIDADSRKTGKTFFARPLSGDLRESVLRHGPLSFDVPPTSGNAWSRQFIDHVFPLPEVEGEAKFRGYGADGYLSTLAPLFGQVKQIPEPQAAYRRHGKNNYANYSFEETLHFSLSMFAHYAAALRRHGTALGIEVDDELWSRNSWHHKLNLAVQDLSAVAPAGDSFILVDEEQWNTGGCVAGRKPIPFMERDGRCWGKPRDDREAIQEIERLRLAGANFMVFAWPAFWWLDHYSGMTRFLRGEFKCVLENERLVVFDMRERT